LNRRKFCKLAAITTTATAGPAKLLLYRTWDFGEHFHENPAYYLRIAFGDKSGLGAPSKSIEILGNKVEKFGST
jgi:hypothetical protein